MVKYKTIRRGFRYPMSIVPTNESQTKIISVVKALRVLELFDSVNTEYSLTQISNHLMLPKSTLLNFMRTLESEGYICRNPVSQNYRLGIKLMRLGYNMRSTLTISHYAIPCMEDLCEQSKGNVYLTTYVDGMVLYLEGIYSNRRTTKYSVAGKTLPMHVTASGKAILSYLPAEQVDAIISKHPLVASTKYTITDPDELRREIKLCHDRGYAFDNQEETLGIRCIAIAIRDPSGNPVGALSISGPSMQMTDERRESFVSMLTDARATLADYTSMFPCCPILS